MSIKTIIGEGWSFMCNTQAMGRLPWLERGCFGALLASLTTMLANILVAWIDQILLFVTAPMPCTYVDGNVGDYYLFVCTYVE